MVSDPTFTLGQAMAAQSRLRDVLGLPPEAFPVPALIGMLSDEIERMRAAGFDDADVALLIQDATGQPIDTKWIARHYAAPDKRQRPAS